MADPDVVFGGGSTGLLVDTSGMEAGASPTGGSRGQDPALLKTAGDDSPSMKFGCFSIFFLNRI